MITMFNFNSLFSQAWFRAVVPANIVAGFKTCGVFPLNHKAIKIPSFVQTPGGETSGEEPSRVLTPGGKSSGEEPSHVLTEGESSGEEWSSFHTPGGESSGEEPSRILTPGGESSGEEPSHVHTHTPGGEITSPMGDSFTPEQEKLFRKRVEEKYNLSIDRDYVRWLGIHHPHLLPTSGGSQLDTSVAVHFSSITPETPITGDPPSGSLSPTSVSKSSGSSSSVKSQSTGTQSVSPTPTLLSSTPRSQIVVSKFLTSPPVTTPSRITPKSLPCARLLTSASSLVMLEEKEKKKQEQIEERERKKREREEKKKQRQEETKRKAEERAKKALEKDKRRKSGRYKQSRRKTLGQRLLLVLIEERNESVCHLPYLPRHHVRDHLPRRFSLTNPLVTALIPMYAACASEPMMTISWKEQVQNGFPVHVGDGCMKTVVKIV